MPGMALVVRTGCALFACLSRHAVAYVSILYTIHKESDYLPRDEHWILGNVTTKEYIHGPSMYVLGFGETPRPASAGLRHHRAA